MPLRTPTWDDESGSVSLVASASIAAPMAAAVALVLDARTYPRWNRFHPSLTVHEIQRSVVALPRCLRRSEALVRIENNTTTLREGVAFTVAVAMDLGATRAPGSRALRESPAQVVSVLEEFERDGRVGVRLAWRIRNKTQGWIMRSERVQEFLPAEHDPYGAVDYVVWETFHGLFASSLPTIWGKSIHHGFVAMINGLKHHAEASARGLEPDWRGDDKLRRRP
jgi:hypothetical protein